MRRVRPCPRLIDEVFAAGDEALKKKCRYKMSHFKAWGKTIVFLSHALNTVKALRQGGLLLSKGSVATIGTTEKVMDDCPAMLRRGTAR